MEAIKKPTSFFSTIIGGSKGPTIPYEKVHHLITAKGEVRISDIQTSEKFKVSGNLFLDGKKQEEYMEQHFTDWAQ